MKRFLAWAILPAGVAAAIAAAPAPEAQSLPSPYPEARYSQMSARSPFAVATAAATAAPTPGFAAQLYVVAVAQYGDTYYVGIKSRDTNEPNDIFLAVGKSTSDGMKVESVKWSNEIGKSTVDVSKNGERATLEFDEDTIKTAAGGGPQPGAPGIRLPTLPGQGRPMNFPMQSNQPQFNNRFAFPQPGATAAGPNQINNPLNALRRRSRPMIPSGQ